MLDDETIGFGAKKPVRLFNQRLGLDYPGVFKALLKGTAAYFMGNALGAVNAAIDGVASFRIERGLPPPVLAWHLIRLALARAMAELTIEALKSLDQEPDDPAAMVAQLDGALENAEIWIDRDFFARPGELRIVEVVRGPSASGSRASV